MTGALLSFSAMAVAIRQLAGTLNIFEMLAVRAAVGMLILISAALYRPALRKEINIKRWPLHTLRNSVHFAAQYAWALALTMLPLATVFAIEFTMPAWTVLLAVWLLGEKLTPSRLGVVVLGLAGVLVILRPGLAAFNPASLLVLLAAMGYAINMITTKMLTTTESTFAIVFWMAIIQLPIALVGSDPFFLSKLGAWQIIPAIALGVGGTTAHFCLSNAFRSGDATVVVPMDFLRIPLIAVVGWMFYNEALDIYVFIGALIIIVGVLWNLRAESARPH